MTVNVAVATYHGVVLGCDSLSSIVERAYFPFRTPDAFARDEDGNLLRDAQGRPLLVFSDENLQETPTNIMGGVQKMFLLYEDSDPTNVECSVAATTSGLGTLNGVVIAELADRFRRKVPALCPAAGTAEDVVQAFIAFIRPQWEQQVAFADTDEATRDYLPDLQFLVSGYGTDDDYIKVFRVSIARQEAKELFSNPPHCSAAWAGQSNALASLINGIHPSTQWSVGRALADALQSQRESVVRSVLEQLRAQGVEIPEPFEAIIDEQLPSTMPWQAGAPEIDWANLPVQSAVDLASTLVNAESAIQKFAMGIPTVGGRTRIGLMRRGTPFAFLNEPQIVHEHVGYNHDA
ncbi:hypothetical protein [Lysobacter soli]|uniref:hypothetical protein n=1 Tax=Lysobacter soli TaxID=453783 RepID=UPI0024100CCD|nr:hypothetical protein [Lysobacter soli]MDG2517369.1 hypothetical protein [Lysobacter soli]